MPLTQREFDKQYEELINRIQRKATPFPHDTTTRQIARRKRALADPFFFAATYFPHYIDVGEKYRDVWKDPNRSVDWVEAGFAPVHTQFFSIAAELGRFNILAAFRESAKDTLLGKIDVIRKLVIDDRDVMRWFIPVVAMTDDKAEGKIIPIKLELERNVRLRSDFGELVGNVKWEQDHFVLGNGRGMRAYGRNIALRGEESFGHRPDHIILNDVNDPMKPDGAGQVQKFVDSVKSDILLSVNSTRWSALFLCNYTVKGDIVDALMTWKHTDHYGKHVFRALVPNPLETKDDREIARQCREAGYGVNRKSAWEARHPTVRLLWEEKSDPVTFSSERQMIPRNRKDQLFKDEYLRFHTREQLAQTRYVFYTGNDPSAKDAGDPKAIVTVGYGIRPDGTPHIPVVRAWIEQRGIDDMLIEGFRHNQLYTPKRFGLEVVGSQILFKREYKRLQKSYGPLPIHEIETKGESKESRIQRLAPFIKEGIITFDPEDPGQEILLRQLTAFPNGGDVRNGGVGDDGPDALEMAVRMILEFEHDVELLYETVERRSIRFAAEGAY